MSRLAQTKPSSKRAADNSEIVRKPADHNAPVSEKHFSPAELAKAWGVSVETIRSIFREEPGVLKLGKTGTKVRRGYFTLRIPQEVAERVHRRLSA